MADLKPNPMPATTDSDAPQPCCVYLRCKSMYYRDDERPGRLHVDDAMGYWCGVTNDDKGPDGHAARHADCQHGRRCYVKGAVAE